jgi:hypothetical protein
MRSSTALPINLHACSQRILGVAPCLAPRSQLPDYTLQHTLLATQTSVVATTTCLDYLNSHTRTMRSSTALPINLHACSQRILGVAPSHNLIAFSSTLKFGPTRTGPEHRRRSPQCHRHEARGGCSYDRVLPKSAPGTPKHTGSNSRTRAHEHRSQWRGDWRLDRAREEEQAGATAAVTQRMCGSAPRPHVKFVVEALRRLVWTWRTGGRLGRDWNPVSSNKARGYCCRTPDDHRAPLQPRRAARRYSRVRSTARADSRKSGVA